MDQIAGKVSWRQAMGNRKARGGGSADSTACSVAACWLDGCGLFKVQVSGFSFPFALLFARGHFMPQDKGVYFVENDRYS